LEPRGNGIDDHILQMCLLILMLMNGSCLLLFCLLSCVDARGDDSYLSTPGGDYAELSDAMYVFFEQT